MKYPVISRNAEIQAEYLRLRRKGESHNMAEMLATRRPSGSANTDRAFMEGRMSNSGLNPKNIADVKALQQAKAAGIPIGGKVYVSQLADKRGPADPAAWVGGRDDVIASCKARGKSVSGHVNFKHVDNRPVEAVALAPDIVERFVNEKLRQDPGRARNIDDLRDEVIEKHGSPVDTTMCVDVTQKKIKRGKQTA